MSPESNKAVVRRYIEMWNTGASAIADEILAPDYVDHAHPEVSGPSPVKEALARTRAALPDFQITIESILGEDELVALRGRITRTQRGQPIISHVLWLVRLAEGQMRELWTGSESSRQRSGG